MLTAAGDFDIIDEALQFFKANVFFRNYEIKVIVAFVGPKNGPELLHYLVY